MTSTLHYDLQYNTSLCLQWTAPSSAPTLIIVLHLLQIWSKVSPKDYFKLPPKVCIKVCNMTSANSPIIQHHIIWWLLHHCCTKPSTLDCDNSSLQMSLHHTAPDHYSNYSNTSTQGCIHNNAPSLLHHTSSSILHQCSCTNTSTLHQDFSTTPRHLHHSFTNVLTTPKLEQ